jgi:hypothetical protein
MHKLILPNGDYIAGHGLIKDRLDHYHASCTTQDMTTSTSATAGLFYRASSEVVLDKRPPVPTLTPCVCTSLVPCARAFLAPHACAFPAPYVRTFPVPSCDSHASEPSTAPPCKAILDCITLDHELEHALSCMVCTPYHDIYDKKYRRR